MVEVQLQHLVDQGVQLGQIHQRGIGHDTVAAAVPVNNINIVSGIGIQGPLFFCPAGSETGFLLQEVGSRSVSVVFLTGSDLKYVC